MKDPRAEIFLNAFRRAKPDLEIMQSVVIGALKASLDENDIKITLMESRIKEEDSFLGKLERKNYKYSKLEDITDLLGVRIVTFYTDGVDKVAAAAERLFNIDWENSVDKRKAYDPDRFGYMSLHYVCSVPEELYHDPEHPDVNRIRFELQMRTALQHVWATVNHSTGYKSSIEIPREYVRELSMLAGVLELADQQFSDIITSLSEYKRKAGALVKDGRFGDLSLDGDTFGSYLELKPFDRITRRIASVNAAEIVSADLTVYLEVFRMLGFTTLEDIEALIRDYSEDAYRIALSSLSGTDLDIVSESVGVQNLCIAYIVKNGGGLAGLKRFYEIIHGRSGGSESAAKRTLARAGQLNLL